MQPQSRQTCPCVSTFFWGSATGNRRGGRFGGFSKFMDTPIPSDPDDPSPRIGALIALLGSYTDSEVLSALDERRWQEIKRLRRDGFVYLCRNNRNGYIKIGYSKTPAYREKTLQSEEPDVEFIRVFPSDSGTERELHGRFAAKRLRGEWFDLTEQDIAAIDAQLDVQF